MTFIRNKRDAGDSRFVPPANDSPDRFTARPSSFTPSRTFRDTPGFLMGAIVGGVTLIALLGFVIVFAIFAGGLTLAGWNLYLLFTGEGDGWNIFFALIGFWLAYAVVITKRD